MATLKFMIRRLHLFQAPPILFVFISFLLESENLTNPSVTFTYRTKLPLHANNSQSQVISLAFQVSSLFPDTLCICNTLEVPNCLEMLPTAELNVTGNLHLTCFKEVACLH